MLGHYAVAPGGGTVRRGAISPRARAARALRAAPTGRGAPQLWARDHRLLLDHQGADDRHGRDDVGLPGAPAGAAAGRPDRGGSAFSAALCAAAAGRALLGLDLLAGRCDGGGVRHDGRGCAARGPGDHVVSTTFYAIVLTAVFLTWQRSELTLSIHSILTRRRELFYWAAVLATFALGTAAGDMTGARWAGLPRQRVMFAALIAVPAVAYRHFGMNATPGVLVRLHRDAAAGRLSCNCGRARQAAAGWFSALGR